MSVKKLEEKFWGLSPILFSLNWNAEMTSGKSSVKRLPWSQKNPRDPLNKRLRTWMTVKERVRKLKGKGTKKPEKERPVRAFLSEVD